MRWRLGNSTSGAGRDPLLDKLDRGLVKTATILAGIFFVLLTTLAITSRRGDLLQQSLTPGVIALIGAVMMRRKQPRALIQLAVSGTMVIFYVGFADRTLQGTAIIGLVSMGMAGSLFVRRHLVAYTSVVAAVLSAATIWWQEGLSGPLEDRLLVGSGPILLFVFVAWLLGWMRGELLAGETRYRNLFDDAPVGIFEADFREAMEWIRGLRSSGVTDLRHYFTTDPSRQVHAAAKIEVLNANREGIRLIGGTDKTRVRGKFSQANPDSWVRLVGETLLVLWEGRTTATIEAPLLTLRGDQREVVAGIVVPVHDEGPDFGQVVFTLADVTERSEAQRSLQQTLKSREEFVASVSHELRTPLTAVVGLADELSNRHDEFVPGEVEEFVGLIAAGANEMAHIVEDLLVAARSGAGRLQLKQERVQIAAEAVAVAANHTEEVSIGVNGAGPFVIADPVRIRQIIRNLLANAKRYGDGSVRITVGKDDSRAYLAVRDEGAPIPDSLREQIFDPYYRARPADGLTSSVGLGLTVSRQLARMMGGELSYTHDGTESIFTLALPLAGRESTAGTRPLLEAVS